ncbi:MAG: biotin--[acetyl-CoA-carboxylase] ligase [Elusimicrobia bacterium]|nr:biotin--[acetyl-CoA-carboxylase] ligase [Elusimicrobiota bacterium]
MKLGENIIRFSKIDSTQNFAKKTAEESEPGTIITSKIQTKGRGRFERKWYSRKGGLFFSIILKPQIEPQKIPILTYKMALAILDTIKEILTLKQQKQFLVFLKRPNDVMILQNPPAGGEKRVRQLAERKEQEGTRYKKIAGILTESSIRKNKTDWVIIGAGININNIIPLSIKNTAVSLKEIAFKKNISLALVFNKTIKNFKKYYNLSNNEVLKKYKKNSLN